MKEYKNATRTQKWIREAFASLIAEKKSLDKITVAEIIKRADITKPTFYYHYSDLNDLVRSIENEMLDELNKVLDEASNNTQIPLEYYIKTLASFLEKNEEEYKALANATDLNYFIARVKKILAKKLDNPSFGFSNDSQIRSIQRTFISGACVDTLMEYFKGNIDCDLKEVESSIIEGINKLRA